MSVKGAFARIFAPLPWPAAGIKLYEGAINKTNVTLEVEEFEQVYTVTLKSILSFSFTYLHFEAFCFVQLASSRTVFILFQVCIWMGKDVSFGLEATKKDV